MKPSRPAMTAGSAALCMVVLLLLLAAPSQSALAGDRSVEAGRGGHQTGSRSGGDHDGDGVQDQRDRCQELLPGGNDIDEFGCPTAIDPFVELAFEDETHEGWYIRFWTGACDRIPNNEGERTKCWLGKLTNSEDWFETVEIVAARVPAAERPVAQFDLWRLGRLIGYEWARANDVRLIGSSDIKLWGERLRAAAPQDVCEVVGELFAAARTKLANR